MKASITFIFFFLGISKSIFHGSRKIKYFFSPFTRGFNGSIPHHLVPSKYSLTSGSQYGKAVAIWSSMALVSAANVIIVDEEETIIADSAVFVFEVKVDMTWSNIDMLRSASGVLSDGFGEALALGNYVAVVGAWKDNAAGAFSGRAYVYHRNSSYLVNPKAIFPVKQSAGDYFGYSVAIGYGFNYFEDGVVLVGAYGYDVDDRDTNVGAVFLFVYSKTTANWIQTAILTPLDASAYLNFGRSLACDGDVMVVGAPAEEATDSSIDAAYVYRISPQFAVYEACEDIKCASESVPAYENGILVHVVTTWYLNNMIKLVGDPTAAPSYQSQSTNDLFGVKVAVHKELSPNGEETVVVAVAATKDDANGFESGAVYVFERSVSSSGTFSGTAFRSGSGLPMSRELRKIESSMLLSDRRERSYSPAYWLLYGITCVNGWIGELADYYFNIRRRSRGLPAVLVGGYVDTDVAASKLLSRRGLVQASGGGGNAATGSNAGAGAGAGGGSSSAGGGGSVDNDYWQFRTKRLGREVGAHFGSCLSLQARFLLVGADYGGKGAGDATVFDFLGSYKVASLSRPNFHGMVWCVVCCMVR